jgi:hypothetical protein
MSSHWVPLPEAGAPEIIIFKGSAFADATTCTNHTHIKIIGKKRRKQAKQIHLTTTKPYSSGSQLTKYQSWWNPKYKKHEMFFTHKSWILGFVETSGQKGLMGTKREAISDVTVTKR